MKNKLKWILLLLFLVVGLTVGAAFDMQINNTLYNPHSLIAILMESFGFYTLYIPLVLLFLLLATDKRLKTALRMLGVALSFTAVAILYNVSSVHMADRGIFLKNQFLIITFGLVLGIVLTAALYLILSRISLAHIRKLWLIACVGVINFVANNLIIHLVMKKMWQRPRYDDMLASNTLDSFRAWYQPFGPGGSSFPSGHTGAACGIFVLFLLCSLYTYWYKRRAVIYTVCWGYAALMALCRVIIGRHFLSDTIMAIFISYIIFWVITSTSFYKKALADTLTAAASD